MTNTESLFYATDLCLYKSLDISGKRGNKIGTEPIIAASYFFHTSIKKIGTEPIIAASNSPLFFCKVKKLTFKNKTFPNVSVVHRHRLKLSRR